MSEHKNDKRIASAFSRLQEDSQKVDTMKALRKLQDPGSQRWLKPAMAVCAAVVLIGIGSLVVANVGSDDLTSSRPPDSADTTVGNDEDKADPEKGTAESVVSETTAPETGEDPGELPPPPTLPDGESCSARGMSPNSRRSSSDPVVDATLERIVGAAVECDWAALEVLIADGFTASFGGGDPIELWRESEANGGSPMRQLVTVASIPPTAQAPNDPNPRTWPWFFRSWECGDSLDGVTAAAQTRSDMASLGFDPIADCEDGGPEGYIGHRLGINSAGEWVFFVAGD